MKKAAVAVLKASLSEYLSRVRAGEEILVTDRGKPIAKVVPLGRDEVKIPPELLALEQAGLAAIGGMKLPPDFWNLPRPKDPKGLALKAVVEEREGGR
jgi:prevent-host-death family protein